MDARIDIAEKKLALISEISMLNDSKLLDRLLHFLNKSRQTKPDEISEEDWASIQRGMDARDAGEVLPIADFLKELAEF